MAISAYFIFIEVWFKKRHGTISRWLVLPFLEPMLIYYILNQNNILLPVSYMYIYSDLQTVSLHFLNFSPLLVSKGLIESSPLIKMHRSAHVWVHLQGIPVGCLDTQNYCYLQISGSEIHNWPYLGYFCNELIIILTYVSIAILM